MHVTPPSSRRSDSGFSLIEILIAIVVLGIISVPVANAFRLFINNMSASSAVITGSRSGQMGASFFAQDVQSAGVRNYDSGSLPAITSILPAGDNGATCGSSGTAALVRFLSDEYDTSSDPPALRSIVVSWALVTTTGDVQLVRFRCIAGALASQVPVAHYVTGTPVLTCYSSGTTVAACAGTSPVPRSAKLEFTVTPPKGKSYTVTLSGVRRQT
jgi:prepilin-type N-terminal cleavage/methylation domain-containing protein